MSSSYGKLASDSNDNTPETSVSRSNISPNATNNNNTQQHHAIDIPNTDLMSREGSTPKPNSPTRIKLNFRTLTGQIMQITLPTLDNVTILQLKERVSEVHNIPVNFQRLIFAGRELLDNQLARNDCAIENECTIHLLLRQNQVGGQGDNNGIPPVDAAGQAYGLPVPVDQNGVPLNLPAIAAGPPLTVEQQSRLTRLFQYSRLVKMFSIIDLIFLVISALTYPIFAIGILLALAGFYGSTRYIRSYVSCYLLYIALTIGVRIWLFTDRQSVLYGILMVIGILLELYIGSIVWKFMKLLKDITPNERAELVAMQNSMRGGFFT